MVGDDEDQDRHLEDGEGIQGGGHDRLFVSYVMQWRSTRRGNDDEDGSDCDGRT